MSGKKTAILLGIGCMVLLSANAFIYMVEDHSEPVITFGSEVPVYTEGMTDEELLVNVKAQDKQDGNLTEAVTVQKVSKRPSGIQVTYLVKDSSNHVATAMQVLQEKDGSEPEQRVDTEKTDNTDNTPEEPTEGTGDKAAQEAEATPEPTPTEEADPEAPVITLNTDAVTLKRGETFSYAKYIDSFSDNKDSQSSLGRSIRVEGADTNTPGVQEVRYYIIDNDGNKSVDAILTLTIE